jgi:hypothetical protein
MSAYTAFLDNVLPHVPGCTPEMALLEIKNTVIDFCEKSLILQQDHDPVTAITGIVDYDLEPPSGYLVVKIMNAWYKGVKLDPLSPDQVETPSVYNQNSGYLVNRGDPRYILQKDARTFSLYPIPSEDAALAVTMRVALKPTRSATTIDDLIYEEYAETIGAGAVSRLALSPGKPYSNRQLAADKQSLYIAGLNVARDRAQKGYVRSSKHVRMRRI